MPRPSLPPVLTNHQFMRLLQQWAWQRTDDGENLVYRKGNYSIKVSKIGASEAPMRDVDYVAKIDEVSTLLWIKGPKKKRQNVKTSEPTEEELTYFVHNPNEDEEWQRIHAKLSAHDVLKSYVHIREKVQEQRQIDAKRLEQVIQKEIEVEPISTEPLPVKADDEGYISLTDALALVGLKEDKLSFSSCCIIASLSEHDFFEKSGRASSLLLDSLPLKPDGKPLMGVSALSTRLREWERANLIWRETNGKRTFKIGLCLQVRLTEEQRQKYLKDPLPVRDVQEVGTEEQVKEVILHQLDPEPVQIEPEESSPSMYEQMLKSVQDLPAEQSQPRLHEAIKLLEDQAAEHEAKAQSLREAAHILREVL